MPNRLHTVHGCRVLLLLSSMLLIVCGTSLSQEGKYLTDFVGKVNISLNVSDPAQYNLSPAETGVLRQNLQRLRDLLIAQPTLNPPRGIEVKGYINTTSTSLCEKPPCPKVPVASSGIFWFYEYLELNGKPVLPTGTEVTMCVSTNEPEAGLMSIAYGGVRDLQGHLVGFQLPKIGEVGGYPLYRNYVSNVNIIFLTKIPKPIWVPLTQEAFLLLRIRETEAELAKMAKAPHDPAGDAYRDWIAKKPEREKVTQETYEQLKKTDPQKAEKFLADSKKDEMTITEDLRKWMEKNPPQARTPLELDFERRLARHKAVLEGMTPAQRQSQVRYFPSRDPIEPDIVPMDAQVGNPLVIANPDFFDPALPRTAIQLIAVSFTYGPGFDPTSSNHNISNSNPANVRLREMEQKSDWRAISSILSAR